LIYERQHDVHYFLTNSSPLIWEENLKMVIWLTRQKASTTIKDNSGKTPLDCATSNEARAKLGGK
jgi:hypothetical protein